MRIGFVFFLLCIFCCCKTAKNTKQSVSQSNVEVVECTDGLEVIGDTIKNDRLFIYCNNYQKLIEVAQSQLQPLLDSLSYSTEENLIGNKIYPIFLVDKNGRVQLVDVHLKSKDISKQEVLSFLNKFSSYPQVEICNFRSTTKYYLIMMEMKIKEKK